jgi:hypothetical protein
MDKLKVLVVLMTILACSKPAENLVLEGDYYIKLIDIRLFNLPDTTLVKFETSVEPIPQALMSKQERWFAEYVKFLKENKLIRKPYIWVRQSDGKIKMLFLNKGDYDEIQKLSFDLEDSKMKIEIRTEVKEIKYDSAKSVYEAIGQTSINKTKGKTYWEK